MTSTRWRLKNGFWWVAVVAVWAAMPTDGGASTGQSDLGRISGTYRYVGGEEEVRAVEQAIDEVVDQMNVFIRGIARRRLRAPNLPTNELRITLEDGQIRVVRTGQPEIAAPQSGERVAWRNPRNGNELQVAHRVNSDGVLEQSLVGDNGVSTNSFIPSTDGLRLSIRTVIRAEKLPAPIRFSTTYRRKSDSGAGGDAL